MRIGARADLERVSQVQARAVIGENAKVGRGVEIREGAKIGRGAEIGDWSYVAEGVVLAGGVKTDRWVRILPGEHCESNGPEASVPR